jgi:major membrane immunogen (membrane-anchored lipoprotein)
MALIVLPAMAAGCRQSQQVLHDGYYTAQSAQYCAEGWKDYLTIYVNDGVIATAEFNAVNSSGLLRSWDQDYMSKIYDRYHVNPNLFPRLYINYLLSVQDPDQIQPAKHGRKTHEIFVLLARQAIESSRLGNLSVAEVHLPQTRFPDDI